MVQHRCSNCGESGHKRISCVLPLVTPVRYNRCNNCGETGHRADNCTNTKLPIEQLAELLGRPVSQVRVLRVQKDATVKRGPRACRACGVLGHTARTCGRTALETKQLAAVRQVKYMNSEKGRATHRVKRLRKYGLDEQAVRTLVASQDNKCAICGTVFEAESGYQHGPHIDHDHVTLVVRGALCGPCNRGLGSFRDNPTYCINAAEYLRKVRS